MTLTVRPTKKELANAISQEYQTVASCRCSYEINGKHVGYCGAKRTGPQFCDAHNEANCPELAKLSLAKARLAAKNCLSKIGTEKGSKVYFEKLTGIKYAAFESFALGFTCPQPETLTKFKNASQAMFQMRRGVLTAMNVFERFYLHSEDTKAIADRYEVAEYIVVKLMNMNDELRFKVKVRKNEVAA